MFDDASTLHIHTWMQLLGILLVNWQNQDWQNVAGREPGGQEEEHLSVSAVCLAVRRARQILVQTWGPRSPGSFLQVRRFISTLYLYLYSIYFAPEWPGRCSRSPSWPTRTLSTGGRSLTSTGSSRTSWTRFVKMEDWIWWMIALFPRYHNLLLQQRSHLPAWKQFKEHKHNCFRGFGENPAFKTHTPCKQTSIPSLPIWCRWVLEFDPR